MRSRSQKPVIAAEKIREVIDYNPLTGIFLHKYISKRHPHLLDKEAGHIKSDGYRSIVVGKKDYLAQRLAWIIMTGKEPDGFIRFKDKNKTNLKWENLHLDKGAGNFDHTSRDGVRAYRRLKLYGVTMRQYEDMLIAQKGCCAICGQREKVKAKHGEERPLAVDHDHDTGYVRGLLCFTCNAGIGSFQENIDIILSAITYLTKYKDAQKSDNVIPLRTS